MEKYRGFNQREYNNLEEKTPAKNWMKQKISNRECYTKRLFEK